MYWFSTYVICPTFSSTAFAMNITILAERTQFLGKCGNLGLVYDMPKSIEEVQSVIEESKSFVQDGPTLG